jgi:hypothetical protein
MALWTVVFNSTGTVAFRSTAKKFAQEWLSDNNTCPRTGRCLGLFRLTKGK